MRPPFRLDCNLLIAAWALWLILLAYPASSARAEAVSLYPQIGHSGPVTAVAFSPDGRVLASFSPSDGDIRLWDVSSWRLLKAFHVEPDHDKHNLADRDLLSFSADGKHLASLTLGSVRVWEWLQETAPRELPFGAIPTELFEGRPNAVSHLNLSLRFSPDSTSLALWSEFGEDMDIPSVGVALWDLGASPPDPTPLGLVEELDKEGEATPGVISLGPSHAVVVKDVQGRIHVWQARQGRWDDRTSDFSTDLAFATFSGDGRQLATLGSGVVKTWDFSRRSLEHSVRVELENQNVSEMYLPSNGRFVVLASPSHADLGKNTWIGGIFLIDLISGKSRRLSTSSPFLDSPNGRYLATNEDEALLAVDLPSETFLWRSDPKGTKNVKLIPIRAEHVLKGEDDYWDEAPALLGDGGILAVRSHRSNISDEGANFRWIEIDRAEGDGRIGDVMHEDSGLWSLAYSPEARLLAKGGKKVIEVVDLARTRTVARLGDAYASNYVVALSPDDRWIAIGDDSPSLVVRDVQTGHARYRITGFEARPQGARFSPDGHILASWDECVILLQDAETGRLRRKFRYGPKDWDGKSICEEPHLVRRHKLTFSSNGNFIAAYSIDMAGDRVYVWGVDSGTNRTFKVADVAAVSFDDSNSRLLTLDKQGLSTWDIETGTRISSKMMSRIFHTYQVSGESATNVHSSLAYSYDPTGWFVVDLRKGEPERIGIPDKVEPWAYSEDSRAIVAVNRADDSLELRQSPDGLLLKKLPGAAIGIRGCALMDHGRRIVVGTATAVRIFDTASGQLLASLFNTRKGDGLALTPGGYYDFQGKPAEDNLNVRVGDQLFGIESYREHFFRPDIVRAALADNLSRFDTLSSVDQTGLAPRVDLIDPPSSVDSEYVTLDLKVLEQGGGLGDLRLFLNGTAVYGKPIPELTDPSKKGPLRVRVPVALLPGRNELKVIAFNAAGTMSGNSAEAVVDARFSARRKPQLHALIVGIQEFENSHFNLQYTRGDAEAIRSVLERNARNLFDKVDLQLLVSKPETSKSAIKSAFARMKPPNVAPDDVFLFYAASHGVVDGEGLNDRSYYLITSNVGSSATAYIKRDALSQEELRRLIADVPATKKLVLLDTCYAGDVGGKLLGRGLDEDSAVKLLSRSTGIAVIAASTSQQMALEGFEGHGVFTYELLEALNGKADAARKGYVTPISLADYVTEKVPEITEKLFHAKQYPTFNVEGQPFPIVRD
jgi:WD40 repeat protein